jgi:hypothetical protein
MVSPTLSAAGPALCGMPKTDLFLPARQTSVSTTLRVRAAGVRWPNQMHLPEEVTLKLDGAYILKVKAVDRENLPITGVQIGPWIMQKPGYEAEINLSGTLTTRLATGADGTMVLDWLPKYTARGWNVIYRAVNHFAFDRSFYKYPRKSQPMC